MAKWTPPGSQAYKIYVGSNRVKAALALVRSLLSISFVCCCCCCCCPPFIEMEFYQMRDVLKYLWKKSLTLLDPTYILYAWDPGGVLFAIPFDNKNKIESCWPHPKFHSLGVELSTYKLEIWDQFLVREMVFSEFFLLKVHFYDQIFRKMLISKTFY